MEQVRALGRFGIRFCENLGLSGLFLIRTVFRRPHFGKGFGLLVRELYFVGVLSLAIIVISGFFIGMVLALQGYNILQKFGADSELGPLVALSLLRELGPVVTALLFAGRAGSALTAEIGLMKTTEQLDSMEMMAVDPLWRIIAPRFWAGLISMPILATIFSAIGILGSYWIGVDWLGGHGGTFWSNMQSAVDFRLDVVNGIIKSLVFGFVVTWIAVFQGYNTTPTAEGISRSTTRTVVYSSLAVLGLDFILTAMMVGLW